MSRPAILASKSLLIAAGAIAAAGAVAAIVIVWWMVAAGRTTADPDDAALVALGKRVYVAECASCHGVDLEGQPNWRTRDASGRLPAPPHDAGGHTWHHPDEQLFEIIKHGLGRFVPSSYLTDMPKYEGVLSDGEIWAVLAYIKSTWPADIRARQAQIDENFRANN